MWYKAVRRDPVLPLAGTFVLNCSGHETSLPPDIICDFRDDCQGGKDEVNCAYVTGTPWCPGGHVFGSSCYHLLAPQWKGTWQKAENMCVQQYNGHLVTPNTGRELQFLSHLIFLKFQYSFATLWYLGFRRRSFGADLLYRKVYQAVDGTSVFGGFKQQFVSDVTAACALWDYTQIFNLREVTDIPCYQVWTVRKSDAEFSRTIFQRQNVHIVCEVKKTAEAKPLVTSSSAAVWTAKRETFECVVSKERVSLSRRCDWLSDCWDGSDEVGCAGLSDVPSYVRFTCTSGRPLWYSHVCDGVSDCVDGSDEEFCAPASDDNSALAVCDDGVPVPASAWCDAKPDCLDASDELDCSRCNGGALLCPSVGCLPPHWAHDDALDCHLRDKSGQWILEPDFVPHTLDARPPPGVVRPDGYGKVTIEPLDEGEPCPPTHAQCPKGYCIPIHMLCNGHTDCPEGEDELAETCQSFCEGRYKCHQTSMCLHDDHVCDGWFHCPLHDDETFCWTNDTCPPGCVCSGEEITCRSGFTIGDFVRVRRLDVSHTARPNDSLTVQNHYIIALFAHNSNVRELGLLGMTNLYHLDLSDNALRNFAPDSFEKSPGIRQLFLARNELSETDLQPITSLKNLEILDVSGNAQVRIRSSSFTGLARLRSLQLDDMGLTVVETGAFDGLLELRTLTMRGNSISVFQQGMLLGLSQLTSLSSDNYKLCCPVMKPKSLSTGTCQAPKDEISSCEDILRTPFFRVFLWLVASLTILGNSCVLVYRLCVERKPSTLGYNTFVINLSASDLLMGIYLAIIGAADQVYKGRYLWEADSWQSSSYCSLAGFLSTVSSEVSALTICMVTLDRYLALAFPLANVHLTPKKARCLVLVTWVVGVLFAGVPLLPPLSHWRFYAQTAVCVPLPITRADFPGRDYAFSVFIVLNLALFVAIAVGQVLIYRSVKANSLKMTAAPISRRNQDTAIARKLALVVITDFLCWFPIGVMGLLSKVGVPIPGEVNVVATIFILPLNSALNPILYTLPALIQKLEEWQARPDPNKAISAGFRLRSKDLPQGNVSSSSRQCKSGYRGISRSARGPDDVTRSQVCLATLRVWLETGKVRRAAVRQILSRYQMDNPSSSASLV
ncbi:G-protein coupled receptor GRL101 [Aplysia californica]|uniref:G-protein coupled receptor GRL101 n=1 Tax=Aplysia californica TaxID=6500 RepID=A0ABM0K9H7_APLCA|nr:G-protein coupled receptor GRL101 [Aplysia californica]